MSQQMTGAAVLIWLILALFCVLSGAFRKGGIWAAVFSVLSAALATVLFWPVLARVVAGLAKVYF